MSEAKKGYVWEGTFESTWGDIEEDESGALIVKDINATLGDKARLKRHEMLQRVRKGDLRQNIECLLHPHMKAFISRTDPICLYYYGFVKINESKRLEASSMFCRE